MLGSNYDEDKVCALAGIAQCAMTVDELAVKGREDEDLRQFGLRFFLARDQDEIRQLLADRGAFVRGLRALEQGISGQGDADQQRQLAYAVQIIQVGLRFLKSPAMLATVGAEIDRLTAAGDTAEERIEAIGRLYENTISTLPLRIQVRGSQGYLRQTETATKIRALLFFGIRFAVLWKHLGGTRFDFLLRRGNIRDAAAAIIRPRTH